MILANLATLGFRITDVKLLLNTHAHSDHAGGLAELKRLSGAQLLASAQDAGLLESGGHGDFYFAENGRFPAVHVDRRLNDGDQVSLGNHVLTAHMTPGHTNGCTTWTFDVTDSRQRYHVVDVCGLTILPGTRLRGATAAYPEIERDYRHTYEVLKALSCDIFLGAHASYYDGSRKAARQRANPMIQTYLSIATDIRICSSIGEAVSGSTYEGATVAAKEK